MGLGDGHKKINNSASCRDIRPQSVGVKSLIDLPLTANEYVGVKSLIDLPLTANESSKIEAQD